MYVSQHVAVATLSTYSIFELSYVSHNFKEQRFIIETFYENCGLREIHMCTCVSAHRRAYARERMV